ncbi:YadA-like C-terminal region [Serratia fonticola]|uniref:YadA-like family protein n=1 Tax=Serratia fonticola TaxID=47917 RepID=UPI0021839C7F|nr:YadA-like family protein [Serratia fonticola]CAI2042902.1 YadA-like C-terminal region [Serratia fonticola]
MTIQKTLLASLTTLAAISGIAHADSFAGALTELQTIQSGMSQEEINQKIQRFIERAPEGTNIKGVLEDLGLTYTSPTVNTLPHQALITPHLDAPVIDRSSHLDSNVTQEQRDTAKAAAEELAAYHHNNPEGNPTHQNVPASHQDDRQNEQSTLTAGKYASANIPRDGIDGKNGADGKDGQSITGKKGAKGKDADMTLVNANVVALRGVRNEQAAQGAYIQQNSANVALNRSRIASNSAAINQNSHDIAANRKDIDENTKDIKRVGAMAQAVSSLHYNRNESGYAVAAGEYDGEASIAGGMQFSTSQDSAVTMQVSWDGNATGAGVGFHSNF